MSSTIKHTNGTIFALSLKDDALKGMGTTVVLAYYIDGRMYVAHVGDSRAYLFDGEKLTQITKDHSIVQEMLDRGELTEEQARIHPYKHVITRVLGVTSDVEVDINILDFTEEDVLILCSDGLTNMLSEDEIEEILGETPFKDSCQELISRANERGGQDNITVALICGDKAE